MSLEDLKNVWDSQNPDTEYRIDEQALFAQLKKQGKSFGWIVTLSECFMTGVMLFVAMMFFRDPVMQGHDLILIVPGILCVIVAIFVVTGRWRRKQREIRYDQTLLGIVEKSISRIEYQIRRSSQFVWWFSIPQAIGLLTGLIIVDPSKRHLFYFVFIPLFIICIGLCYWQIGREIKLKLAPERERLEHLRSKLVGQHQS